MTKFIVTSDTGSGEVDQYKVADSIEDLIKDHNINSVLLLGDNIYETGVTSIDDPQFIEKFEDPYQNINKPFYLCLGNHDYGNSYLLKSNSQFQIDYSDISDKWNMPSKYYSIVKKPCEFFFLDTNLDVMSESQIMIQFKIMADKLKKSKQKWKIVCGHHPWRSVGGHGNADKRFEYFMNDLCKESEFHLYMCGHDHCKNIILKNNPIDNSIIPLLVIGTGGKKYHGGEDGGPQMQNMTEGDSELLFHSPNLGVCLLDATQKRIILKCYDENLNEEFKYIIK